MSSPSGGLGVAITPGRASRLLPPGVATLEQQAQRSRDSDSCHDPRRTDSGVLHTEGEDRELGDDVAEGLLLASVRQA